MVFLSGNVELKKNHQQQKHHKQNYRVNNKLRSKWNCFSTRCETTQLWKQETEEGVHGCAEGCKETLLPTNSFQFKKTVEPNNKSFSPVQTAMFLKMQQSIDHVK